MTEERKSPAGGRASTMNFYKEKLTNSSRNKQWLSFKEVNAAALAAYPSLLGKWLPDGMRTRGEYVALNPRRPDRHKGSFKINLNTGVWCDFASGDKGGDPVSLYAYLNGISQFEALKKLAKEIGV